MSVYLSAWGPRNLRSIIPGMRQGSNDSSQSDRPIKKQECKFNKKKGVLIEFYGLPP
jgi:hypothetical protein